MSRNARRPVHRQPLPRTARQAAWFAIIGVVNTVLHFLVYQGLLTFGTPYLPASALGYAVGLVNSFILNRRITFRDARGRRWRAQFVRFGVVNLLALASNLLILEAVVRSGWLAPRLAVVPAVVGSLAFNFIGNKFWTFRD